MLLHLCAFLSASRVLLRRFKMGKSVGEAHHIFRGQKRGRRLCQMHRTGNRLWRGRGSYLSNCFDQSCADGGSAGCIGKWRENWSGVWSVESAAWICVSGDWACRIDSSSPLLLHVGTLKGLNVLLGAGLVCRLQRRMSSVSFTIPSFRAYEYTSLSCLARAHIWSVSGREGDGLAGPPLSPVPPIDTAVRSP